MGDRTWVRLRVPLSMRAQAEAVIDNPSDIDEYENGENGHNFANVEFSYEQVNYGQLHCLGELQKAGIPYDSEWGSGYDYGAGTEHCRFTEQGELSIKEIYENEANPPLPSLLALIDAPKALRKYILEHQESRTILPWDNQEAYGKLYRTHLLITT